VYNLRGGRVKHYTIIITLSGKKCTERARERETGRDDYKYCYAYIIIIWREKTRKIIHDNNN